MVIVVSLTAASARVAHAHRPGDYGYTLTQRWGFGAGAQYVRGLGTKFGPTSEAGGTLQVSMMVAGGVPGLTADAFGGVKVLSGEVHAGVVHGAPDGQIAASNATTTSLWFGVCPQAQLWPFLAAGGALSMDFIGWTHYESKGVERRDFPVYQVALGPTVDVLFGDSHSVRLHGAISVGGPSDDLGGWGHETAPALATGLTYQFWPGSRPRARPLWGGRE